MFSPGAFIAEAQCMSDKVPEVQAIILKNLARAATYKPSQAEIDLAVNTIITAELLNDQSVGGLAMGGALDELWGFGYDYRTKLEGVYRSVTPAEVETVAKKYLTKGFAVYVAAPPAESGR